LVRIYNGTLVKGKNYGLSRVDGSIENFKLTEVLRTKGLERVPVEEAGPGDIVAIAGVSDIMIGETIVDPNDPKPLPLIHVDEPAISMTFGTNDSPLVGTEGKDHKLTARMLKDRLSVSSSATCRFMWFPPSALTLGRCRAAANSRWPFWPSRCAAKATS
jgi:GTP-binding protein